MSGIRDIKRQIVSVQNTQKVTKAMKMVSAAKMRRANEAMVATRPYADKIKEIVKHLSTTVEDVTHPLVVPRKETKSTAVVVVNSDRGLCGAFNSSITKFAAKFCSDNPNKNIKFFIVGKNAYDYYKRRNVEILEKWVGLGGRVSFDTAKQIGDLVVAKYLEEHFDEVYLIYNEFKLVSSQIPTVQKLLPLSLEHIEGDGEATTEEYIFEPAPEFLLQELIPRYLNFTLYHALLESAAGEHGARMVAMENATRSADDMVKKLKLNYNKARQASITTDLLDILNGAEALK